MVLIYEQHLEKSFTVNTIISRPTVNFQEGKLYSRQLLGRKCFHKFIRLFTTRFNGDNRKLKNKCSVYAVGRDVSTHDIHSLLLCTVCSLKTYICICTLFAVPTNTFYSC